MDEAKKLNVGIDKIEIGEMRDAVRVGDKRGVHVGRHLVMDFVSLAKVKILKEACLP